MCGDRPANTNIIRACFECLARSHESFLIARLRPGRTNSRHHDFDFVAEFAAKCFDFMRTGHNSIDFRFNAQFRQAQDLIFDVVGDSNFAEAFVLSALVKTVTPKIVIVICGEPQSRLESFRSRRSNEW